ncbi:response regulator transcription factor [Streptomyces sp. NPDC050704]|uniref:response regulator transcription factor n=1 Tax=Streptomyces sp. NPDC050704 TaxID=3157219 RepID=UPI00341DAA7B
MIRVLLAVRANMLRGGLAALLAFEPDIAVVAETEAGDSLPAIAQDTRPDVAVIGINLLGVDGLTAAQALRTQMPQCRTLILVGRDRTGSLHQAFALPVGGLLLEDAEPGQLANAIRKVAAGETVVDYDLLLSAWQSTQSPLTRRQAEVLRLIAHGCDVLEIAAQLSLSPGTVRNHLSAAVARLRARTRVDAIRIAGESGWL